MKSKRTGSTWCLVLALGGGALPGAGCASSRVQSAAPLEIGASASALVGPDGAVLEVGSMEVAIPAGALAETRELRIVVEAAPPPGAFTGFSPVVRFEPSGIVFARPIEVRIPFEGDEQSATIFWSQRGGETYVPRTTRVVDGVAIAEADHFASAFVGTACRGDCCGRANGELDLLLVVDNSRSMSEEQELLRRELPRVAAVLATGDRDGDGVQDFPAFESVHVGITTTDLGAGPVEDVPTCETGWGDDGQLLEESRNPDPSCTGSYARFASYDESDPATLGGFVEQVTCVSAVGQEGCGFEQQLEATLLALSPSAPTDWTAAGWTVPSFPGGRAPRGDGSNAGFLRPGSILAIVEVTDEDDTSVRDPGLFDPADPRFSEVPLNVRGLTFSDPSLGFVQPMERYADGLAGLRANPADLIFAAVAGVPAGVIADAANVDFPTLEAHPGMVPRLNDTGTGLAPSCESDRGVALAPVRLVAAARELGARGAGTVLASICEASFDPLIDGLIERVSRRAAGSCE
jgi:hypothetical protein